jgi:hypothetical protein
MGAGADGVLNMLVLVVAEILMPVVDDLEMHRGVIVTVEVL